MRLENRSIGLGTRSKVVLLLGTFSLLGSCSGKQSALDAAGREAIDVATLFWVMTVGAFVIWALVISLALYASRWKREPISEKAAGKLIIWAGVVFPTTVLIVLMGYALWLMPSLRPFTEPGTANLRVEVEGSQFWWHVVYVRRDGSQVISANEIRLPVGERVEFLLTSRDMIHSFWIPSLGGKMDLIPGRQNRLSLIATRAGTYRGQCAEFCGKSHAHMAFAAVAMEPADFEAWLDARSRSSTEIATAGQEPFLRNGCGECHRIEGTSARGTSGPDLSHIGSRLTIGAGLLDNNVENLSRFIIHSAAIKPGSQMPAYERIPEAEIDEIAEWLKRLQ